MTTSNLPAHGSAQPAGRRRRAPVLVLLAALLTLSLTPGVSTAAAEPDDAVHPSIFGGVPADIADLPGVVYLEAGDGACTGTVIASTWVLTAAHCFGRGQRSALLAIGVDRDLGTLPDAALFVSRRVIVHPDYDERTLEADLALIELTEPTDVTPHVLAAADAPVPIGAPGVIAGWGMVRQNPNVTTDVLRRGDVGFYDCRDPENKEAGFLVHDDLLDAFVCATSDTTDTCVGDSGGPLFARTASGGLVQFGITSYGLHHCDESSTLTGVYVSVPRYHDWIAATAGLIVTAEQPRFADVAAASAHAAAIAWLVEEGITTGCGESRYCPDAPVTRAQMATFLTAALGYLPADDGRFTDVPAGTRHAGAIGALADNHITTGCGNGRYCPDAPVTRAQMATFLTAALGYLPTDDGRFTDVPIGTRHAGAIGALADNHITTGCGTDRYCPDAPVTRAQMATFLRNALS